MSRKERLKGFFIRDGGASNDPDGLVNVHDGNLSQMDAFEHMIHEGSVFIATDTESMSDTQTKEYIIETSDIYDDYHLRFDANANNSITVVLFRDPNISDAGVAAASDIATQNKNDNYSDLYSDCQVGADPTQVTSYGVPWIQYYSGGGWLPTKVESDMFMLAQNSQYVIQVTSNAANTTMNINIVFYAKSNTAYTVSPAFP